MSVEATLDVSDVEREKKMKLFELELDVNKFYFHEITIVITFIFIHFSSLVKKVTKFQKLINCDQAIGTIY